MKLGSTYKGQLVDATLGIVDANGKPAQGGRLYPRPETNPRPTILLPGKYKVTVKPLVLT